MWTFRPPTLTQRIQKVPYKRSPPASHATAVLTTLVVVSTFDQATPLSANEAAATVLVVGGTYDPVTLTTDGTKVLTALVVASTFPPVAFDELAQPDVLIVTGTFDPVVTANEVNVTSVTTSLVVQSTFPTAATDVTQNALTVTTILIVQVTVDLVVALGTVFIDISGSGHASSEGSGVLNKQVNLRPSISVDITFEHNALLDSPIPIAPSRKGAGRQRNLRKSRLVRY